MNPVLVETAIKGVVLLGLTFGVLFLLAAFVAWRIAGRATRPLHRRRQLRHHRRLR